MKPDPQSPEVIARAPTDIEASLIVTALSDAGIKSSTTGGFTAAFVAEAPGDVSIVVRFEDVERARHVLAEMEDVQEDFDWSSATFGTPEDGEEF